MMNTRLFPLLSIALFAVVIAGCDSAGTGNETVVLSANSPRETDPTVEYDFRYTSDDVQNNQIGVVSESNDRISSVLSAAGGFDRSAITSARVDSVTLVRVSGGSTASRAKVFQYLRNVDVFLGSDASGKKIAEDQIGTTQRKITLDLPGGAPVDVTSALKQGGQKAFLRLGVDGSVPSEDAVEVTVYYRIVLGGG